MSERGDNIITASAPTPVRAQPPVVRPAPQPVFVPVVTETPSMKRNEVSRQVGQKIAKLRGNTVQLKSIADRVVAAKTETARNLATAEYVRKSQRHNEEMIDTLGEMCKFLR